jgi:hypothetical protein
MRESRENEVAFRQLFGVVRSLYPSPGTHEESAAAYWTYLRDLPFEALKKAARKIPSVSPKYFPSAGTWRELAEIETRRIRAPRNDALGALPEPELPEPPEGTTARSLIDQWRIEDNARRASPDGRTERDIGLQRIAQIKKMLDV